MKKIIALAIVLFTLFSLSAAYVIDEAGLLDSEESAYLESLLDDISSNTGISMVVATARSSGSLGDAEYADRIGARSEYGTDSIVFFLNIGERTYYISTQGYAARAISYSALSDDSAYYDYLVEGNYAMAFASWARNIASYVGYQSDSASPSASAGTVSSGGTFEWEVPLFFSIVIGLSLAALVVFFQKKELKNSSLVPNADDYVVPNSFKLTLKKDIFLYSHVDRTQRPDRDDERSSGAQHGGISGHF